MSYRRLAQDLSSEVEVDYIFDPGEEQGSFEVRVVGPVEVCLELVKKEKGKFELGLEHCASRAALFDDYDGLEEGGLRASSSYPHDIDEHDNEKAMYSLQDRVIFLKRLTGDIHDEVESHNRMLDRMGNEMDASRGIMSGTMDRFKMVFEKRSSRKMCALVVCFVVSFSVLYYSFRLLMYFMYE